MMIRRFAVYCAALALASTLAAQEIPTRITTRLWDSPGPAQDEEGGPRLLIVYPGTDAGPSDAEQARYGGRVDPPDANVTLNGTALDVGYGGVFIGMKDLPAPGESATWSFTAKARGKTTTVKREVAREADPPPPLKAKPLAFWRAPIAPAGDYWLREGSELKLTLYASPEATAEYRLGPARPWEAMQGEPDARRGGVYRATVTIPNLDEGAVQALAPVEFRLRAGDDEKTLTSKLKIGILRKEQLVTGEILINRVTYLKNSTGWERWGNWVRGTLFPVYEQYNDRLATTLGTPGEAYVDNEEFRRVKLDLNPSTGALVKLGIAGRSIAKNGMLGYTWTDSSRPIAFKVNPLPSAGDKKVIFQLLGASEAAKFAEEPEPDEGVFWEQVEMISGRDSVPEFHMSIQEGEQLWGWDMTTSNPVIHEAWAERQRDDVTNNPLPDGKLSIFVRTKPHPTGATPQKPLTGLRIMLDPGHGGKDSGAIGPSGLTEADLNLVQAGYVERALLKLGATVKVTRRDDTFIELDERVEMALAWQPDLFVSLHHNSVGGGADPWEKSGPEMYAHYAVAYPVGEALAERLGPAWGGAAPKVMPHVARVIRNYTACPAVLVETAYVTNPKDEVRLRRSETEKLTGEAIARGIADLWQK